MVASAEVITVDREKYVEQLLELFRCFSLLVSQVKPDCLFGVEALTQTFRASVTTLVFGHTVTKLTSE